MLAGGSARPSMYLLHLPFISVILAGDRVHVCVVHVKVRALPESHVFSDFAENRVNHRTSSSRFPGISRDRCGEARACYLDLLD